MHIALLLLLVGSTGEINREEIHRFEPIYGIRHGHPWDMLQETFYVRRFTTGETYYHRLSFNTPWFGFFPFVEREDVYRSTMDRLASVLSLPREEMEESPPLKRLLFFRDLWTVFENIHATSDVDSVSQNRRDKILLQLARIMRRLELSEPEIAALPDTLTRMRSQSSIPGAYNPQDLNQPFLPTNLLDEHSDWVTSQISNDQAVGAPSHNKSVNQRSLFTIHVLAPGGRSAGESLLKKANKSGGSVPFPPGTVLALLRRAIAGSQEGKLVVTKIVESIQLIVTPIHDGPTDFRFKFALDRSDLLNGKPGLRMLDENSALDVFSFESTGQWSQQSKKDDDGEPLVLGKSKGPAGIPSLGHCVACHGQRTHELYANFGPSGVWPSTNRELSSYIEKAKAQSDDWLAYLRLRK